MELYSDIIIKEMEKIVFGLFFPENNSQLGIIMDASSLSIMIFFSFYHACSMPQSAYIEKITSIFKENSSLFFIYHKN